MNIKVPQLDEHANSFKQWDDLVSALHPAFVTEERVDLDFENCGFMTAEGIALLAGLKFIRDEKNLITQIDSNSISDPVKVVFVKSGLLPLFGAENTGWISSLLGSSTTLPIYRQKKLEIDAVIRYIDEAILARAEMPIMSDRLKKEIRKAFFELFGNIFYHSGSVIGGIVCGQIFPRDQVIQIVFCDYGVGIATRVIDANPHLTSDTNAIEWALAEGNSTLSDENISRGLGLFLIRKFIEVNGGVFRICANRGAVMENAGIRRREMLSLPFIGTIIDMRIKIKNDVRYTLYSPDEQ